MRKFIVISSTMLILTLSMTCQKKALPLQEEGSNTVPSDTITYNKTDRDDIPPSPDTPWWTLDTTDLDECQSRLWGYLRTMYPVNEENYWDYDIYAIKDEPEDIFEHREFISRYLHFFIDTIYSEEGMLYEPDQPCSAVDTTFFRQALGPPTCVSQHVSGLQTTYFYNFKMRYRRGPCPHIFDEGSQWEHKCYQYHLDYCALLMIQFAKQEGGKMTYISFYGPGG